MSTIDDVVTLGPCWQGRHRPAYVGTPAAPPPTTSCSCGAVRYVWTVCPTCGFARWVPADP